MPARTGGETVVATAAPRRATAADLPAIRALLASASLPVADLGGEPAVEFLVLELADGTLAGAIGLERHGRAGLLRSLVVDPARRAGGLGARLVAALEDEARAAGIDELVLLTQTAERFFANRGYAVVDRTAVPPAVQSSREFRSLCPASAVAMLKRLT